ncbi:MAG: hypothetical protein MK212_07225 [Saprospiraceae bacterium]|nr:hypothetical protein [Saprospiraceae bacterium]
MTEYLDDDLDFEGNLNSNLWAEKYLQDAYIKNGEKMLLITSIIHIFISPLLYFTGFYKYIDPILDDPKMHIIDAIVWEFALLGIVVAAALLPSLGLYAWHILRKQILLNHIKHIKITTPIFILGATGATFLVLISSVVLSYLCVMEGRPELLFFYILIMLICLYQLSVFTWMIWQLYRVFRIYRKEHKRSYQEE